MHAKRCLYHFMDHSGILELVLPGLDTFLERGEMIDTENNYRLIEKDS